MPFLDYTDQYDQAPTPQAAPAPPLAYPDQPVVPIARRPDEEATPGALRLDIHPYQELPGLPSEADALFGRVRRAEGTDKGSGYVYYGGLGFTPTKDFPQWSGAEGPQGKTHAAGPGQWQPDTWNGLKPDFEKRFGREPDFSSEADQKAMTWLNAAKIYPGGEAKLRSDLAAGKLNTAALAPQWAGFAKRGVGGWQAGPDIIAPAAIAHEQSIPGSDVGYVNVHDLLAALPTDKDTEDNGGKAKHKSLTESIGKGDLIRDLPYIDVQRDKNGQVKIADYDGLHRLRLLAEQGYDVVPVGIRGLGAEAPGWIEDMHGKIRRFDFQPISKPPAVPTRLGELERGIADIGYGMARIGARMGPEEGAAAFTDPAELAQRQQAVDQATINRDRQIEAERQAAGQTGTDWWRLAGNVLGTAPLALTPVGEGALPAAAVAAGTGAASSLLTGLGRGASGQNALGQAGLGALTGGATMLGGNALARVAQPYIEPAARTLLDKGVRLLPGQVRGGWLKAAEEKMTSVPFSGSAVAAAQRRAIDDWNRATYNDVLGFIGERYHGTEIGNAGLANVERQLSARYEALKPAIRFDARGNDPFDANVANLESLASGLPSDLSNAFDGIVNRVRAIMGPEKTMDGQTFKEVESELSSMARGYFDPRNTPLQRKVGEAINSLLGEMRENMERHSAPEVRPQLKALNTAWAAFKRLQQAGTRRAGSEGVFTPMDLLAAERSMAGRNVFARGDGLLQTEANQANRVLGNRYPDSGTAGRYGQLGEIGELIGLGVTHPALALAQVAGQILHAGAYTSSGLNMLRGAAGIGFPRVRNMLARGIRQGSVVLAPASGAAIVSQ